MSNTLSGGRSVDLNVQAGQSLKVTTISGTYTAIVLAGAGAGSALATDSASGATYGPYTSAVTIRVKVSATGFVDYDVGAIPSLDYKSPAYFGHNADGDISSLVDAAGNAFLTTANFGSLAEPWCIAHRGAGAMLAPDSILSSYAMGVTFDTGIVDGGDWHSVSDGGVYDFHDSTLNAKTNQTGNTVDATSMQMRGIKITASSWFGGNAQDVYGAVTPTEFFSTLRGKSCFAPEPQTLIAANYLADYLNKAGLKQSCLVNAFADSWLTPFLNLGFPYVLRNLYASGEHAPGSFTPARAAALYAMGVRYIGIQNTDADAASALATAKAAGLKVMVGTLLRQKDKVIWDALGVNGYVSDDPLYFMGLTSKYRRLTSPFGSGTYYHGHLDRNDSLTPGVDRRGTLANGRLVFAPATADVHWILQGWGSPIANAASSYTLTVPIKFTTLVADKTRWPGIAVCSPDDSSYSDITATSTGYQIWVNPSSSSGGGAAGALNIIRKVNGVGVGGTTSSALSAEITAGSTLTLTIAVTPTTITVTASGAATGSVNITDSVYRGGYFHFGHAGSASGAVFEFSASIA